MGSVIVQYALSISKLEQSNNAGDGNVAAFVLRLKAQKRGHNSGDISEDISPLMPTKPC